MLILASLVVAPGCASSHLSAAARLEQEGRYAEALVEADLALAEKPDWSPAVSLKERAEQSILQQEFSEKLRLARQLLGRGELEHALTAADRAVEISPGASAAKSVRAEIVAAMKVAEVRRRMARASELIERGQLHSAEAELSRVLEIESGNARASHSLKLIGERREQAGSTRRTAEEFLAAGKTEEADRELIKASHEDGEDLRTRALSSERARRLCGEAQSAFDTRRDETAVRLLRKALDLCYDFPEARRLWMSHSRGLQASGKTAEAMQQYLTMASMLACEGLVEEARGQLQRLQQLVLAELESQARSEFARANSPSKGRVSPRTVSSIDTIAVDSFAVSGRPGVVQKFLDDNDFLDLAAMLSTRISSLGQYEKVVTSSSRSRRQTSRRSARIGGSVRIEVRGEEQPCWRVEISARMIRAGSREPLHAVRWSRDSGELSVFKRSLLGSIKGIRANQRPVVVAFLEAAARDLAVAFTPRVRLPEWEVYRDNYVREKLGQMRESGTLPAACYRQMVR